MTDTLQLFFALLAVAANLTTAILVAARLGWRRVSALAAVRDAVTPLVMPLAAVVAAGTMLGSLYFSEIAHYIPCSLCWLQRTVAYPVAVILVIAAVRRDLSVRVYVLPLVIIGTGISTYHWLLERYPQWETDFCGVTASCASPWFTEMGFITLAYMAFSSFTLIASLLALPSRSTHDPRR